MEKNKNKGEMKLKTKRGKCLKRVKKRKLESFFFIEGDLVVINFTFRMKK